MAPKRHQTTTDHPNLSRVHAKGINLQHPALFWRHQLLPVSWCSIRWLPLMTENVTLTMRSPLHEQSEDDVGDYLDWGGHWGRRIDQLLSWANSFDKKTPHSSQSRASWVCQGANVTLTMRNSVQEQSEDGVGDYLDWGRHWGRRIDPLLRLSWANSFDKKTLHSSRSRASRVCQGAKEGLIVKFP